MLRVTAQELIASFPAEDHLQFQVIREFQRVEDLLFPVRLDDDRLLAAGVGH